ncbi:AAA family ATPase [Burkholderia ubonensis]|uniref:AAA family ATPase n=1 Tax=Burkholderia ubonensis TaxID=101571 RepID=UPI0008FE872D|nr:AAA family ATPase [Burkholderia ubonensis]
MQYHRQQDRLRRRTLAEPTSVFRERLFCVVLFDEIRRAHPRILDQFLQMLDDERFNRDVYRKRRLACGVNSHLRLKALRFELHHRADIEHS